jgi:two-component system chemotaxis response regulator CheY
MPTWTVRRRDLQRWALSTDVFLLGAQRVKSLIVEDDETSALFLKGLLSRFGECNVALNGVDGVKQMHDALTSGKPYNLICLDMMMPHMDGQTALSEIRNIESDLGIKEIAKVVMTTSVNDKPSIIKAIQGRCDGYLVKPIQKTRLLEEMRRLSLV